MAVDVSQLEIGLQRFAAQTMTAAGPLTAEKVRADSRTPRGDTLELVGSIRSPGLTRASGVEYSSRVFSDVIQAATTDKGAMPHIIRPRRPGGLLVFNWPKAGGTVFLRRVNHPGNRAQNWFEPAVRQAFAQALNQAARSATTR